MSVRLFIAIPCSTPFMYTRWVIQFLNQLNKYQVLWATHGGNEDGIMAGVNNHPNLPTNRNELVRFALDPKGFNATHILFLDSDILMPNDMVTKMIERDLDIHGLLCFTRDYERATPIIYRNGKVIEDYPFYADSRNGLIEVDATGTGCLMVKRRVFDIITHTPEFTGNGNRFFVYKEDWTSHRNQKIGEDLYFCSLARKNDFKILVDTINTCKHLTPVGINGAHVKARQSSLPF